jgi:hypothetical protein
MFVLLCYLLCLVWSGPTSAQVPSRPLPRLDASSLQYAGAFRLPRTVIPSDAPTPIYWSYSGGPMAYHPTRHTLYMGQRDAYVAEVVIPAPVSSSVLTELPVATHGQPATDPTSRTWANLGANGAVITNGAIFGGIAFAGDRMVLSATPYYPGSGADQKVSHGTASPTWAVDGKQWSGWKAVGPPGHGGFLGGWMLPVPQEWQAAVGGPFLTGQGAIPIISRTSWGPALSAFDPAQLATTSPVPVLPLLEYPSSHPTLGGYADTPSLPFNRTAAFSGAIFPPGTRSILFFGSVGVGQTGLGDTCYGLRTQDVAEHQHVGGPTGCSCNGAQLPFGEHCCYDLANGDKGPHGYPYVTQVLAYDATDLAGVKAGTAQPWEMLPYARWTLTFPFPGDGSGKLAGVAYDSEGQRLFVAQYHADRVTGSPPQPLIHVYAVNTTGCP